MPQAGRPRAAIHKASDTSTFAAEIGDVRRFDTPRQLMSFLGLVPAERSTGETVRRTGLNLGG